MDALCRLPGFAYVAALLCGAVLGCAAPAVSEQQAPDLVGRPIGTWPDWVWEVGTSELEGIFAVPFCASSPLVGNVPASIDLVDLSLRADGTYDAQARASVVEPSHTCAPTDRCVLPDAGTWSIRLEQDETVLRRSLVLQSTLGEVREYSVVAVSTLAMPDGRTINGTIRLARGSDGPASLMYSKEVLGGGDPCLCVTCADEYQCRPETVNGIVEGRCAPASPTAVEPPIASAPPLSVGFEGAEPVVIPAGSATGVVLVREEDSDATDFAVEDVTVEADITHPWIHDVQVSIEHGGVTALAAIHVDGPGRKLHVDTRLADFAGLPAHGAWTLRVSDPVQSQAGTLERWRLDVRGR